MPGSRQPLWSLVVFDAITIDRITVTTNEKIRELGICRVLEEIKTE